jgi:hypothetical protein
MRAFSDSYVSRVLFTTPAPGRSLDVAARRWRWLRSSLIDRIGPSCITCAAPARNGEKSTGAVLGSRAN